jgi:hypothetical protein
MSVLKLLHNKPESKETVLKNKALPALIIAVVFCGLLSLLGTTQGCTSATQIKTETVPSGYLELTASPAEVYANVGDQIEIRCTVDCLIDTPVEISSVDVVLFDSLNSVVREQAMTVDLNFVYRVVYTVVGDESYYKIKVNFTFPYGPSGNYSEYGAHSFPIVVSQE